MVKIRTDTDSLVVQVGWFSISLNPQHPAFAAKVASHLWAFFRFWRRPSTKAEVQRAIEAYAGKVFYGQDYLTTLSENGTKPLPHQLLQAEAITWVNNHLSRLYNLVKIQKENTK